MDANVSQGFSTTQDSSAIGMQTFLFVPELINIAFLLLGLYGMYRGIEIQHPLYAILFFNLIVPLITSSINIIVYGFSTLDQYIKVSNLTNALSVYFHGTCWLLSSFIRYLYIMHNDWLFSKFPDIRKQCFIAIGIEIALTILLMMPLVGTAILLGKNKIVLVCFIL